MAADNCISHKNKKIKMKTKEVIKGTIEPVNKSFSIIKWFKSLFK